MATSLLRERMPGRHAQVTSVELFFDLVFVFAITQISHSLIAHLSWEGAIQSAMLLMAVWWAWIYTTWTANWLDPDRPPVRLMLFALMGLGLVMASSLPDAFEDRGLIFAGAYVTIQLGRTLFILWAVRNDPTLRRNFIRVAIWMCGFGLLWIAGGLVEGSARLALWSLALIFDYAAPGLAFRVPGLGASDTHDWNIEGAHIAERCGLFIILCLGESILVIGATFAETAWTKAVIAAFAVSLVGSIAMWWIYFGRVARSAMDAIAASDDPGRQARLSYTYIPILIVAGIVIAAAGDELVLAHPLDPVKPAAAWVLLGGPALFLLGAGLFKYSLFRIWSPARAAGLALTAALIPLAGLISALALSASTVAILILVAAWESLLLHRGEASSATAHAE